MIDRFLINQRVFVNLLLIALFSACTEQAQKTQGKSSNSEPQNTTHKVQVETLVKTTDSWNGSPLPDYHPEHPEMTALRITIPPHTKLPVHLHPVINAGILLSGALTVISEAGDTLQMKAGDVIVEMVNEWHHGENNGDVPAEIVVFYSGNVDTPVTILKETQETQGTHETGNPHGAADASHSAH